MENGLVLYKPRVGFWNIFWASLGWKLTEDVQQPRRDYEASVAVSSQSQRIKELEREIEALETKLELTNQLLKQYKLSLDRSDKTIESLQVQLKTQQDLTFNLIHNFHRDHSAQAEKVKSDLECQEQIARRRDEERQSEIGFLFNKLFALEASMKLKASGVDLSSVTVQSQGPNSKDSVQPDPDVQSQPSFNSPPLLNQDQHEFTIYAVIDGDGHIFDGNLLRRGAQGGIEAAKLLMDSLTLYYRGHESPNDAVKSLEDSSPNSSSDIQLRVNIFLNSRGLQHALTTKEICTATQYDNFMAGFTQSNPKFIICDVRSGKDAADMKVREHLLHYARNSTVKKVFFGGSHDQGYSTTLETLRDEGVLSKVVLLQGYKQMHKKITSFNLPKLVIPGLFMEERLPRNSSKSSTPPESEDKLGYMKAAGSPKDEEKPDAIGEGKQQKESLHPVAGAVPFSLSLLPPSLVLPVPAMAATSSQSTTSTSTNEPNDEAIDKFAELIDEMRNSSRRRKRSGRRRGGNEFDDRPALPNVIYQRMRLTNRPRDKCRWGHFYILKPEEMRHLKNEGAKTPCWAVQNDRPCGLGSKCPMAHKCPHGPRCKQYNQLGRKGCQFKGESMHQ